MIGTYGENFCLTLFTKDPDIAVQAEKAGVNRIGTDLEYIGKECRQGGLNTWISDHALADLAILAQSIEKTHMFCRINPIHPGSADEIEEVLALGVATIMLPMFTTVGEVERFIRMIDGRAHPVLLLETAKAAKLVEDICHVSGVGEIHIGLNDLRLSLGWRSHFNVLVSDLLVDLSDRIQSAGIRFLVGGLARADDESLPIPSSLVYPQFPRLGATGALVSRAFFGNASTDMVREIGLLRERLDRFASLSRESLESYRRALQDKLETLGITSDEPAPMQS